jgi:hypothetical protein
MSGLYNETSKPSYGSTPGQPGDDVLPGYIEGACLTINALAPLTSATHSHNVAKK